MKTDDLLIIGAVGVVAYMLLKPKPVVAYTPLNSSVNPYAKQSAYISPSNTTGQDIAAAGALATGLASLSDSLGLFGGDDD